MFYWDKDKDNIILADNGVNVILGGPGNDTIYGGSGLDVTPQGEGVGHLSAAVRFSYSSPEVQEWLSEPSFGYIKADFSFNKDLPSDVIMGVDQEWFEGTQNPTHVSGGDWMALAGVTREGKLWFPYGTQESHDTGTPTGTIFWEVIDLGVELSPDQTYEIRLEADFSERRYSSFSLTGGGVDVQVDLSAYLLDYPNQIPIDKPSITNYVFTFQAEQFGGSLDKADTSVYFDNVEAGLLQNGEYVEILSNGFDDQLDIDELPIADLTDIKRGAISEDLWYQERPSANVDIVNGQLKSNTDLLGFDPNLDQGDYIFGGKGDDIIFGEYGNDFIMGGRGNDQLFGGSGNDRLYGNKGDDILYGGWGFDTLRGDRGNDALYGGGGNDVLHGGVGDDFLFGELGEDFLRGGKGNDVLVGGFDRDLLLGERGNDVLNGGEGNDDLIGGNGDDFLFGELGDDQLTGGRGSDVLFGGDGSDVLLGNFGNDLLSGGAGSDQLYGGNGADMFYFDALSFGNGLDEIQDFNAFEGDIINISEIVELTGYDATQDAINDYVFVGEWQGDTYMAVQSANSSSVSAVNGFEYILSINEVNGLGSASDMLKNGLILV